MCPFSAGRMNLIDPTSEDLVTVCHIKDKALSEAPTLDSSGVWQVVSGTVITELIDISPCSVSAGRAKEVD
jgi:hypothetical protein